MDVCGNFAADALAGRAEKKAASPMNEIQHCITYPGVVQRIQRRLVTLVSDLWETLILAPLLLTGGRRPCLLPPSSRHTYPSSLLALCAAVGVCKGLPSTLPLADGSPFHALGLVPSIPLPCSGGLALFPPAVLLQSAVHWCTLPIDCSSIADSFSACTVVRFPPGLPSAWLNHAESHWGSVAKLHRKCY